MTSCPQTERVQQYLDDELPPGQAQAFRGHVQDCAECAMELALYVRVFTALREAPLWDPGPALTERVLDRVLPSRLRRRWVTAIGWSYTTVTAVSTYLFISWIVRPETHVWLTARFSDGYMRLMQAGLFTLNVLSFSWMRLLEGWGAMSSLVVRWAPLGRALTLPFSDPVFAATMWAAFLSAGALLWWMRPRPKPATKEIHHVSLLGF